VAYLVQQGVQHTLLQVRQTAAWWLAMACSFRGPSSRILWQRWLYTCCIRPSLPYSTAASWLIVALFPGLISKYRSKITKQLRRVNNLLSLDYPSFLDPSAWQCTLLQARIRVTIKKYWSRISRKFLSQSRDFSSTNDTLRYIFHIPLTVLPLVLIKTLVLSSLIY